jgi:fatty-acyl-CoA synthase
MRTVLDFLAVVAEVSDRHVFVHDRRGRRVGEWSYRDLVSRARKTGASYLASGLEPGDHVFLQLPNSLELLEGFLGAILVGLVPCCLAPPRALGGIETFKERIRSLLEQFPGGRLVAHADVGEAAGVPFLLPEQSGREAPVRSDVAPDSLAFVQLTSGSTRHPKAVRISHQALLANVQGICTSGQTGRSDSVVSWLPLYHDMGLVGGLFCSLGMGANLYLLQPETFLARPRIWLQTISDVPGPTIGIAPNFAYQACVDRISGDGLQGLDLSRWRLACCGAEKVRAEMLDAFAQHFAPVGFRKESFVPCYGMAEATLAVTFGAGGRIPPVDDGNVSCGRPVPQTEVVIRDAEGNPLAEGEQGEITVRSESLCSGYAGSDENPIREGWLLTGDRGYLRDGELYITGRYKDLIIVDGVNIDPDEIEVIAERTVEAIGGRSGAFSIEVDRRERVVLVSETAPQPKDVLEGWNREIGDRVARLFGFRLYDMVFVKRGGLSKTSSGKVQRAKVKHLYEGRLLESIWSQRG